MPIETAVMLIAVVLVFAGFAAALAWSSHASRNLPRKMIADVSGQHIVGEDKC